MKNGSRSLLSNSTSSPPLPTLYSTLPFPSALPLISLPPLPLLPRLPYFFYLRSPSRLFSCPPSHLFHHALPGFSQPPSEIPHIPSSPTSQPLVGAPLGLPSLLSPVGPSHRCISTHTLTPHSPYFLLATLPKPLIIHWKFVFCSPSLCPTSIKCPATTTSSAH